MWDTGFLPQMPNENPARSLNTDKVLSCSSPLCHSGINKEKVRNEGAVINSLGQTAAPSCVL